MSEVLRDGSADGFVAWELPVVQAHRDRGPRTESEFAALREAVRKEAREEGLREGRAAAMAQTEAALRRFEQMMVALCEPFAELDTQVEDELVSLAIAVAKQLVRRELKTSPGEIVAVVREAMSILPVSARDIRLHLHPDDAELVDSVLRSDEGHRRWTTVPDPVISRGGCRVSSDTSQIDATLEKRLGTTITAVFGDARDGTTR